MKLKTYNLDNCPSVRTTKPAVRINTKSGLVVINQAAVDILGLQPGNKVEIHQDEENEIDWYISKGNTSGFEVREKSNVTRGLVFNNTTLCRSIADSVNYVGAGGKLLLEAEPVTLAKVKYWPLITAGLRNS